MATTALAFIPLRRPTRAPVEWRNLGDLLQHIAARGDREFLDMMAKTAQYHLELLDAAARRVPE